MFLTKNVHNIVKEQHTKLHLQNDLVVSGGLAVCLRCRYKEKKIVHLRGTQSLEGYRKILTVVIAG